MSSERLSPDKAYPGDGYPRRYYRWTGEKRPPKAGEYYLSGSTITAYKSLGDMTYPYHIAKEVPRPKCDHCGQFLP